jgi:hypothetical protein
MLGAAAGTGIHFGEGSLITNQLEAKLVKDYFGISASSNALKYKESSFSPVPRISGGAIGVFGQEYSSIIIKNKSVKKEVNQ